MIAQVSCDELIDFALSLHFDAVAVDGTDYFGAQDLWHI